MNTKREAQISYTLKTTKNENLTFIFKNNRVKIRWSAPCFNTPLEIPVNRQDFDNFLSTMHEYEKE